jgi:hypothetical protein
MVDSIGNAICVSASDFLTLNKEMNLVWCTTVALALAVLVHLKLQHDRDNQPDTVYERRVALNDGVLRLHTT